MVAVDISVRKWEVPGVPSLSTEVKARKGCQRVPHQSPSSPCSCRGTVTDPRAHNRFISNQTVRPQAHSAHRPHILVRPSSEKRNSLCLPGQQAWPSRCCPVRLMGRPVRRWRSWPESSPLPLIFSPSCADCMQCWGVCRRHPQNAQGQSMGSDWTFRT